MAEIPGVATPPTQLVQDISLAFGALLSVVDKLTKKNEFLQHEVRELQVKSRSYSRHGSDLESSDSSKHIGSADNGDKRCSRLPEGNKKLEESGITSKASSDLLNDILRDSDLPEKEGQIIITGYRAWQILEAQSQQGEHSRARQSPKSAPETWADVETRLEVQKDTDSQIMERDFTTEGKHGGLGCPFAANVAMRKQQRPDVPLTPPDLKEEFEKDPIAAEFHASEILSPPPSTDVCALKCPIRFIDQHSPEEVAKYFEKHKHEIPRSHEVCVKRYQSNSESIRKLDAKYGNLVNMIQGLGVKHQPMFPAKEMEDTSAIVEAESLEKVKNWAVDASEKSQGRLLEALDEEEEARSGHFDRPLKEIRLGESPSRPWGIQVPIAAEAKDTSSWVSTEGDGRAGKQETNPTSPQEPTDPGPAPSRLPTRETNGSPAQCPYRPTPRSPTRNVRQPPSPPPPVESHHDDPANNEDDDDNTVSDAPQWKSIRDGPMKHPPMVFVSSNFSGPVFVGYNSTQAKIMMGEYLASVDTYV